MGEELKGQDVQGRVPRWTLITSHGLVLLYLASHPDATIRLIADELQLTERRVVDIIHDLSSEGLLIVRREGRRNHYALSQEAHFRHPIAAKVPFKSFVSLWRRSSSVEARVQGQNRGSCSRPE
jgi:predicted transcriptional regulator